MVALTEKEFLILSSLRQNSRKTLKELSKNTKIPITTLYEKLKNYEKGIIKRYTSILDYQKLGYSARAYVLLKINNEKKNAFQEYIIKQKSVNNVFKVNNGYDFSIEIIAHEFLETEKFIEELENKFGVENKHVSYITGELKTEGFLGENFKPN